jgi:hypothetical protein
MIGRDDVIDECGEGSREPRGIDERRRLCGLLDARDHVADVEASRATRVYEGAPSEGAVVDPKIVEDAERARN